MEVMHFAQVLLVTAFIINSVTCDMSASWQSNMQASKDIYLAFGEKHAHSHFRSADHLSEALSHQLQILSLQSESSANSLSEEFSSIDINHPFMSCTAYLKYDATVESLRSSIGSSFQPHISYTSAVDDRICFVSFIEDTTALRTFTTMLDAREMSLLVPVPDILKIDHSLLHTINWASEQSSVKNVPRYLRSQDRNVLQSHPIVSDIIKGLPLQLSVIFRPSWSSSSQEHSAKNWLNILQQKRSSTRRKLTERTAHWENFVWTSKNVLPRKDKIESSEEHSSEGDESSRHLQSSEGYSSSKEYSSIFERIRKLPPYSRDMKNFPYDSEHSADHADVRDKWSALREKYSGLYETEDTDDKAIRTRNINANDIDKCDYNSITVEHRKNNIFLNLGPNFFQNGDVSAACLSNIIVLLSSDKGVSRIALSTPIRTLNNMARPIMQSASTNKEPYSAAGLNGTGVVVGISDTGIDELSCFFKDEIKGMVPRSSAEKPYTDHSFRKVIQYVNYSGSGGDYDAGHGSHVSGTVAGHSLGGNNQYRGMASGAKLAFFDIGALSGDLVVPSDLSDSIFPSAASAGARLHSNSWGGGYWYDAFCLEVDSYLFNNPDFLVFFAGGNNGAEGYGTVLSPALSKNAVAVAASYSTQKAIGEIAYFSSVGPTPDGRTKPDITAPGYAITSAAASKEGSGKGSCGTASKAGTSMATPVSAGIAALVLQYFQDPRFWKAHCNPLYPLCAAGPFSPKGPTIKALMMHSGVPMEQYLGFSPIGLVDLKDVPDIYQGYGRVDLQNILPLAALSPFTLYLDEATLTPLSEYIYTVTITSVTQPLKVTLSWFDPPNPEFAARVLVHDLDLWIQGPNNTTVYNGNYHLPNKGSRDELNNNEQVTITPANGLILGTYTVKVQAKMLPINAIQAFSLIITAGGVVTPPTGGPTPASASILLQCQGLPQETSTPKLSVDLSFFQMLTSDGWNPKDEARISPVTFGHDIDGSVNASVGEVIVHKGFTDTEMYGRESTCLPKGCYEAFLNLDPTQSKSSTAFMIPACGVFLSPLRTKGLFCVKESEIVNNTVAGPFVPVFPEDACYSLCEKQTHITFKSILGEEHGAGWNGGYYAITPLIAGIVPPDANKAFDNRFNNIKMNHTYNAVAAGTLEWTFLEERDICVPLDDDNSGVTTGVRGVTSGHSSRNRALTTHTRPPQCYSIQLSIPLQFEVFPVMDFQGAWALPNGTDYTMPGIDLAIPCNISLATNASYGIMCVDPIRSMGNVTFYHRNHSWIGQTPLSTVYEQISAYSTYGAQLLGSCGFNLTFHQGEYPFNNTHIILEDDDTSSPTVPPTLRPTPTPTSPIPTPTPTILQPLVPTFQSNYADRNFSCLKNCTNYPGLDQFLPVRTEGCNFFITEVYYLCSSFAVAQGLCPRPACASTCTDEDYCFFGSNTVSYCPYKTWEGVDNSSVVEMTSSCVTAIDVQRNYAGSSGATATTQMQLSTVTTIVLVSVIAMLTLLLSICLLLRCLPLGEAPEGMDGTDRGDTLLNRMRRTKVPTLDEFSTHAPDTPGGRDEDVEVIELHTFTPLHVIPVMPVISLQEGGNTSDEAKNNI